MQTKTLSLDNHENGISKLSSLNNVGTASNLKGIGPSTAKEPEPQISEHAVLSSVSRVITRSIYEDRGAELLMTCLSLNPKRPFTPSYISCIIITHIH